MGEITYTVSGPGRDQSGCSRAIVDPCNATRQRAVLDLTRKKEPRRAVYRHCAILRPCFSAPRKGHPTLSTAGSSSLCLSESLREGQRGQKSHLDFLWHLCVEFQALWMGLA